ncbi:dynamin family protein [Frigidibacter sp. ROC022]|uniref:dynamin family protein n=1 Tax=Frigidibacter sp. ROC022 TaxID=2971796 RepID=UPI00215AFEEF|nr:dynamin family protein [Frigidibacter sp. ROC022]MCR8725023.1 dynamin family protein [Frigidibacter sp. ROC022]
MSALEKANEPGLTPPPNAYLTRIGIEALSDFAERRDRLTDALEKLADIGDEVTSKVAERLSSHLDSLEPSVTMIGQVKAGKTSLVNAMTGMPDILPADVNPWTSVVTSLHLSAAGFPDATRARFKFFGEDDWQRLFNRGGRIGELAARAGAEDELEKVRAQLTEMREKSRRRLGRRFEMLLSQQHDYGYFDRQLIERYVILGDDFETETDTSRNQGRFADITQSADLFIERPDLPTGLCIRDTPGVNDTFMIREQITIRAIRDSRLCVVVLSAHQALSDVDLALVRLISNVKSREVVIFVNRIDELADPGKQVPEIEASIRATLATHQGPENAQIVFGSAYWANRALTGELKGMARASADALVNWAQHAAKAAKRGSSTESMIWELSGVPTLMRALSERIVEGEGAEAMNRAAAQAQNLLRAMRATVTGPQGDGQSTEARLPAETLAARLDQIESAARADLRDRFSRIETEFDRRLERAHASFLDRATASLIGHLETWGENEVWQYDPSALRMLLRTAYQVFSANTHRQVQAAYDELAETLGTLWREGFDHVEYGFRVEPPTAPRVPPPVQIGQTIALDLKGSWWRRWWKRRRGYDAYAEDFAGMIAAETKPMVDDLSAGLVQSIGTEADSVMQDFLATQRSLIMNLADRSGGEPEADDAATRKAAQLDRLQDALAAFAE